MKPQEEPWSNVKFLKNIKMFLGFVIYFSSPVSRGLFGFFFQFELLTSLLKEYNLLLSLFQYILWRNHIRQDKLFIFKLIYIKIYSVHVIFKKIITFLVLAVLGLCCAWACSSRGLALCVGLLCAWACSGHGLALAVGLLCAWACSVRGLALCVGLLCAWACSVRGLALAAGLL